MGAQGRVALGPCACAGFLPQDPAASCPLFAGEALVFGRNENSDLVEVARPATQAFFSATFAAHGPFWSLYHELGFAVRPHGALHAHYFAGRLYFLKNLEARFMLRPGWPCAYRVEDGALTEKKRLDPAALLLAATAPLDMARQVRAAALVSLAANAALSSFEEARARAQSLWRRRARLLSDPPALAGRAMEGALGAMRFVFLAGLAGAMKVRLRPSPAWRACPPADFHHDPSLARAFPYHARNPYDLACPRFFEEATPPAAFPPVGRAPAERWRENARLLASLYLALQRLAYLETARETGLGGVVFFLAPGELARAAISKTASRAKARRKAWARYRALSLPPLLVWAGRWLAPASTRPSVGGALVQGMAAGAPSRARGAVAVLKDPQVVTEDLEGKILVTAALPPSLAAHFGRVRGVVSEGGGRLAHCAIVARELGLPCIVQARGACRALRPGQEVVVDGVTGRVYAASPDPRAPPSAL